MKWESCRSNAGRKAAAWAIDQEKASASATAPTAEALQAKITALCKVECPKGYASSGAEQALSDCTKLCETPVAEEGWLTPGFAMNLMVGGMLGYFLISIVDSFAQSELADQEEAEQKRGGGGGSGGSGGSGSSKFVLDEEDEEDEEDDGAESGGNFRGAVSRRNAAEDAPTTSSVANSTRTPRATRATRTPRSTRSARSTRTPKRSPSRSKSPAASRSKSPAASRSRGRSPAARSKV